MWSSEGRCLYMNLKNMSKCILQRLSVVIWKFFSNKYIYQDFTLPMIGETKYIKIT